MEEGPVKRIMLPMLNGMESKILDVIEKNANNMFVGIFLPNVSTEMASYRFKNELKSLDEYPNIKEKYVESKHKEKWMLAYEKWFDSDRKSNRPTLLDTVNGTKAEEAPEEEVEADPSGVFKAGEITRTFGSSEKIVVDVSGKRLHLQQEKIQADMPGKSIDVELQDSNDKVVSLNKILRDGPDKNLAQFNLETATGESFVMTHLVDAISEIENNNNDEADIKNTSIKIKKINT